MIRRADPQHVGDWPAASFFNYTEGVSGTAAVLRLSSEMPEEPVIHSSDELALVPDAIYVHEISVDYILRFLISRLSFTDAPAFDLNRCFTCEGPGQKKKAAQHGSAARTG